MRAGATKLGEKFSALDHGAWKPKVGAGKAAVKDGKDKEGDCSELKMLVNSANDADWAGVMAKIKGKDITDINSPYVAMAFASFLLITGQEKGAIGYFGKKIENFQDEYKKRNIKHDKNEGYCDVACLWTVNGSHSILYWCISYTDVDKYEIVDISQKCYDIMRRFIDQLDAGMVPAKLLEQCTVINNMQARVAQSYLWALSNLWCHRAEHQIADVFNPLEASAALEELIVGESNGCFRSRDDARRNGGSDWVDAKSRAAVLDTIGVLAQRIAMDGGATILSQSLGEKYLLKSHAALLKAQLIARSLLFRGVDGTANIKTESQRNVIELLRVIQNHLAKVEDHMRLARPIHDRGPELYTTRMV